MSTEIDQRVVEMRFDNKQFEANVKTSMSTIEKLKQSLNLTGVSKGLENVNAAAKNCNMSGLTGAVETVHAKFSAFEVMAVTALANITNSAVNAGKRIVSALTIDPPKDGFAEYELQINSTQTIMANTGRAVQDVNAALDELNEYADLTIYNFAEMTKNAGMFTSAGLGLEDTMTALKGVGNWAAYAGANSWQMSNATYQLGQALNAGAIRLQDWMSIEKSAGMAGKLYKDAFVETAKELGTLDDSFEMSQFRETLKDGWFTTEVFLETMKKFAADSSMTDAATKVKTFTQMIDTLKEALGTGWATSWRTVIGDFEEAKSFFTDWSNVFSTLIGRSADARNNMLKGWSDLGGRDLMLKSLINTFNAVMNVIVPAKEAFRDIFPATTSQQLYNLTNGLNEFTRRMIPSVETADKLQRSFKGVFAVLDILTTITGGALKTGLKVFCQLLGMADIDILSVTASIGDAVVHFREWLYTNNIFVKGLSRFVSGGKEGIKILRGWINQFMAMPEVQRNIERFETAFSNTLVNFHRYLDGGAERIDAFIQRIKAMDSITLDDLADILRDFKDNVLDYFLDVDGRFDDIKAAIKGFKEDVRKHFCDVGEDVEGLRKKIVDFAESIRQKFSNNIGLGEILTVGIGAGLIIFVKKIGDALETIAGPILNFSEVIDGLGKVLKSYALKIKADALIRVAGAIAILAASVAVLTLVDQNRLWSAVGALGVLAIGLTAISAALGTLQKVGSFGKASLSIVGISSALLILAVALKQMEGLDGDKVWSNIAVLGAVAVGLAAMAAIFGKIAPRMSKGSIFLLSFATSLKILVSTLDDLDKLEVNNVGRSLTILLGAMVGLSLVASACKKVKLGSAVSIIAIAVSLKMLIQSFENIGNLDTGKLRSNIEAFVSIFGMFALLMVSSHLAGKNSAKAGVAILSMSAALLIIVQSFKMMADINPLDLDRALDTISRLLLVFSGITAVSNFAGQNATKAGAMLLLMSGAILILSGVMVVLSHLEPSGLARALGAIVALEVVFGALIAITKLAQDCKSTLVILSATIGILAVALGTLSMINPENLAVASASLSAVIGMFALLVASTKLAQTAVGTTAVMVLVVGALGGILYLLSGLPTESTLGVAASLSVLLLSLSGACLILSAVGVTGFAAVKGVGVLTVLITAVTGLIVGIGALAHHFDEMEVFLNKGIPILEKIGYGLGAFFGNVVGGFATGISAGLPEIGNNLSNFMENAQPFFDGIKNVGIGSLAGVAVIVGTMVLLTAAEAIDAITWWRKIFGGNNTIDDFGQKLVEFGKYFKQYADNIAGIDGAVVESSANAAKTLAEFASAIPNSGGVLEWLVGDNKLSSFAQELALFGPIFAEYAQSIAGIDADTVSSSANAAKTLAEFADAIPNSGGKLADWIGDNTLSSFAEELIIFGPKIKEYADSVIGLDANAVTNSATAAKSISELANCLPNSGGKLADWVGDNTLSSFAEELEAFGPSIKKYADSVTGLDADVVTNSANAAKSLAALANKLPNTGGKLAWLTGDNDMATFGANLVSFGENFAKYSEDMENVKPGILSATTNAAESIVKLQNGLPKTGGLFSDDATLAAFGRDIASFGAAFSTYYSYIANINTQTLSGVIIQANSLVAMAKGMEALNTDGMKSFGSALTKLGEMGITGFISSFTNGKQKAISAINTFVNAAIDASRNKQGDFQKAGQYVVEGFVKGIEDKKNDVVKASTKIARVSIDAMKKELDMHSPSKVTHEIGKNEAQGEIDGKRGMIPEVKKSSAELAKASTDSMVSTLKEGASSLDVIKTDSLGSYRSYYDELSKTTVNGVAEVSAAEEAGVESTKKAASSTKSTLAAAITAELDYWERLLEIKKHGAEAEKYQAMTMAEFQKDIVTQTKDLLKEYTDSLNSNTDSLMNNSSLFKEVSEQDGVRASALTKNLKDQIRQMEEYGETLSSLNERIPEGGLKDAINEMGVDSLAELQALNSMTDEQLTNYVSLYDQKYALCQQAATTQLSGLRSETEQKLSEIYGGVNVNLQQLAQSFDGTFESIKGYVAEAVDIGNQLAAGVGTGIIAGIATSVGAIKQLITDTRDAARSAADIQSPSGLFRDDVGVYITEGIAEGMADEGAMAEIKASAEGINDSALETFTESNDKFVQAGTAFVESFKEGMSNSATESLGTSCTAVINIALGHIQTAISNSQVSIQNSGMSIMSFLINGMKNKTLELDMETQTLISIIPNAIRNKYLEFTNVGSECMSKFLEGIKAKGPKVSSTCVTVVSSCLTAIKGRYQDFYNAGSYLVDGFAAGINENTWKAEARARAMARAAADAAEEELDEHSPSRVGYRIGDYFGIAFVNALGANVPKAYKAGSEIAKSAKNGLSEAISKICNVSDIEVRPTIRPVLDLSNVRAGASKLNTLFSRTQAMTISTQMDQRGVSNIQNGEKSSNNGSTFTFTQNNYSPKALSRVEIYRQTRNQFSAMERMVQT